jgi:uncharacterized protein (TIGR00730 family)
MTQIDSVCVFAGSSPGARPEYAAAARTLGRTLAGKGISVVFGGGSVGLMGVLADEVLAGGASVIGVIPQALFEREVGHGGLTELRVVESVHERKAQMAELADAFIALPGGMGTLEELFETLTWGQLGYHDKPCGLLNVSGYWDSMLAALDRAVEEHFLAPEHRQMLLVEEEPAALLELLRAYEPPRVEKWLGREEQL